MIGKSTVFVDVQKEQWNRSDKGEKSRFDFFLFFLFNYRILEMCIQEDIRIQMSRNFCCRLCSKKISMRTNFVHWKPLEGIML